MIVKGEKFEFRGGGEFSPQAPPSQFFIYKSGFNPTKSEWTDAVSPVQWKQLQYLTCDLSSSFSVSDLYFKEWVPI